VEEKTWKQIRGYMKDRGITVQEFAGQVGIARQAVYLWKSNGVPPARAKKVSSLTGIPREQLNPKIFS
tara:strand:+ start:2154 stop:2357 length:204 start_codon:yes stop_codon:yes gene_type:complete